MEDDFFAVGGDSISAMLLCGELRRRYTLRPSAVFARRSARDAVRPPCRKRAPGRPSRRHGRWRRPNWRCCASATGLRRTGAGAAAAKTRCSAQLGQQAANYNAFTRLQFTGALDSDRLRKPTSSAEPLPAAGRLVRHRPATGGVPATRARTASAGLAMAGTSVGLEHGAAGRRPGGDGRRCWTRLPDRPGRRHVGTALVHLDGQRHVLLLVIHRLVVDGWSTPCCCATCSPPTATM